MKFNISKRNISLILLLAMGISGVFLYQNCGQGFQANQFSSLGSLSLKSALLKEPVSQKNGYEGDALVLSTIVDPKYSDQVTYQWKKDGAQLPGQTLPNLILVNLTSTDSGNYTVEVKAKSTSEVLETNPSVVSILPKPAQIIPPAVTSQSANIGIDPGTTKVISVEYSGYPEPSIQWNKDSQNLPGETSTNLVIKNYSDTMSGSYKAILSTSTTVVESAPIFVLTGSTATIPPQITSQNPAKGFIYNYKAGDRRTLSIEVTPGNTAYEVIWQRATCVDAIPGCTHTLFLDGVVPLGKGTSLDIEIPGPLRTDPYTIIVAAVFYPKHLVGSQKYVSTAFYFKLEAANTLSITKNIENIVVPEGGTATFSVGAESTSPADLPLKYYWGKYLPNSTDLIIFDEHSNTLTLTNVNPTDEGKYKTVVTNASGSSKLGSEAQLTVIAKPVITKNLVNQNVTEGDSTQFQVEASGVGLSFTWFVKKLSSNNFVEIPGATLPTLSVLSLAISDSGAYAVDVTNAAGTVRSTATLTVAPAPTATPMPTPTPAPNPTATPTPMPTATPVPNPTATPTPMPTATPAPNPTATPTPMPTATPAPNPTATPTPMPTATPAPNPTATPIVTPMPTATPTPKPTPMPTVTPTPAPNPTATPTATPAPNPTATPTATPTPNPTATPTPAPNPTATPTPASAASCTFGTKVMASGTSTTGYDVKMEYSGCGGCAVHTVTVTCTDGVLDPAGAFATCTTKTGICP